MVMLNPWISVIDQKIQYISVYWIFNENGNYRGTFVSFKVELRIVQFKSRKDHFTSGFVSTLCDF